MSGGAAGLQSGEQAEVLPQNGPSSGNLADILERVLDKGIVIAGDEDGPAERTTRSPSERVAPA
ncbi:gas vesicle protein [Streptomyces albidoflavus]